MIFAIDVGNTNIVFGGIKNMETKFLTRLNTDKEKTEAVIEWVSNYITYDDAYTYCCYPIDVYHHRVGACLAYATLSQELLRLSGGTLADIIKESV